MNLKFSPKKYREASTNGNGTNTAFLENGQDSAARELESYESRDPLNLNKVGRELLVNANLGHKVNSKISSHRETAIFDDLQLEKWTQSSLARQEIMSASNESGKIQQ